MHKKITLYFTVALLSANAFGDFCPPPPSSISPSLSVITSFDKKRQLYRYRYTIKNGLHAKIPINYFGLLLDQAPNDFQNAANWAGDFIALESGPKRFRWNTSAVSPADAKQITNDGTVPNPIYAVSPDKSLSGFEILSSQPPGVVQFFAQGFTQIPSAVPTAENSEPQPNCPAWDFDNSQILTQVTGATTGPSDPAIISVTIRARGESELHPFKAINPKNPSGKMAVLVLSTREFDASGIDTASVVFGPASSHPISSKLIGVGQGENIVSDERADWESALESFDSKRFERKNTHQKNLLLTFDLASLDVQCNLDQALFLRGNTNSGQKIIGTISTHFVGCEAKDYGKHKQHLFKWWKDQSNGN